MPITCCLQQSDPVVLVKIEHMTDRFENRLRARQMRCEARSGRSHIWTGIFIILIGVAALIRVTNPDLPHWLFSWKTFLIALGIFVGLKHNFKGGAWFVLILIGAGFLIGDIDPEIEVRKYVWPVVIIVAGAFLVFRPRHKWAGTDKDDDPGGDAFLTTENSYTKDDIVDSTTIFGGSKKIIISKNFKGGDIVNVFGGTELDLTQADMEGQGILEITSVFGGTKLIIPSNWDIKTEVVLIFGGVEDKRKMNNIDEPRKILVLQGTVIFGGIEIKSY